MNPKKYRPFPQYVPNDGQQCYVARFTLGGNGEFAVFDLANWQFTSPKTEVKLPGWMVVEWRPAS
jgi:hypothetical protein